jgi:hypothetical protein
MALTSGLCVALGYVVVWIFFFLVSEKPLAGIKFTCQQDFIWEIQSFLNSGVPALCK